jgi:hypothetical protein
MSYQVDTARALQTIRAATSNDQKWPPTVSLEESCGSMINRAEHAMKFAVVWRWQAIFLLCLFLSLLPYWFMPNLSKFNCVFQFVFILYLTLIVLIVFVLIFMFFNLFIFNFIPQYFISFNFLYIIWSSFFLLLFFYPFSSLFFYPKFNCFL